MKDEIETQVHTALQKELTPLFQKISEYYEIEYFKVESILDYIYTPDKKCRHRFISGKRKGEYCGDKTTSNGYCKKHQKDILKFSVNIINTKLFTEQRPKTVSKTRQQIIEWLNTAVPQDETILKKRSKGLIHEESSLVFDSDFCVIGKLGEEGIIKISHFEIELCEKRGWSYLESSVESKF